MLLGSVPCHFWGTTVQVFAGLFRFPIVLVIVLWMGTPMSKILDIIYPHSICNRGRLETVEWTTLKISQRPNNVSFTISPLYLHYQGNRFIRLPKYLFLHQIRGNYLPVLCITLSKIFISLPSHPCLQIILWPVLIRLKINKIPSHFSCFLAADVYSFLLFLLSNHFFSFSIHVHFSREAMPFTRCLGCQIFVL